MKNLDEMPKLTQLAPLDNAVGKHGHLDHAAVCDAAGDGEIDHGQKRRGAGAYAPIY